MWLRTWLAGTAHASTTVLNVPQRKLAVVVREATGEDHAAAAKICAASGLDAWARAVFAFHPRRVVIVAIADGEIVGVAKTHHHAGNDGDAPAGHYLGGVVVEPRWRRKGLGLLLTEARLQWIWERDNRAFYFTNERNTASIDLHRPWGFLPIASCPMIHGVRADGEGANLFLFEAFRPIPSHS